jgi:hypothetical protein
MAAPATLKAALDAIDADAAAAPMSSSEYNTRVSQAHYDFGVTYSVAVPALGLLDSLAGACSGAATGTPS